MDRFGVSPRERCCGAYLGQALRYLGPQTNSLDLRGMVLCQLNYMCESAGYDCTYRRKGPARHCWWFANTVDHNHYL